MTGQGRILFMTQTAYVWGGVQTWLDQVTSAIQQQGWECVVGLVRGRVFHDPVRFKREHPGYDTVEVDGRDGTPEARMEAIARVICAVRPDILVPLNLIDALRVATVRKGAGAEIRLLLKLSGFDANLLADARWYAPFIDVAVGVNRLLAVLLQELVGIPGDRVWMIPSGCPPANVHGPKGGANVLRIGFVGRLDADKRPLDLIPFVKALERDGTPYRLDLAGDGPCRGRIESALVPQIATGRVRLLGRLSLADLYARVYPRLNAVLLFSSSEGSPQSVWQAMHHGVAPIVARFLGCAAEGTLRHYETALLFEVGDADAAAAHVRRLHQDRALLDRVAERARQTASAHYVLSRTMQTWHEVFQYALSLPVQRGPAIPPSTQAPSGRLAALGLPPKAAGMLRALARRRPVAMDAGDEWPHAGPWPTPDVSAVIRYATERDRPTQPKCLLNRV